MPQRRRVHVRRRASAGGNAGNTLDNNTLDAKVHRDIKRFLNMAEGGNCMEAVGNATYNMLSLLRELQVCREGFVRHAANRDRLAAKAKAAAEAAAKGAAGSPRMVLNPATGRWVLASGRVGLRLASRA